MSSPLPLRSLADLKKQLAEAKERKAAAAAGGDVREQSAGPSVPIESDRFLTEEDFERIK